MISFTQKGDFSKVTNYFKKLKTIDQTAILNKYGQKGVQALSSNTPVKTGLTASSWNYKITGGKEYAVISFYNTNLNEGVPIAIIIQYGHGTGTGGWVQGKDYINPAIQPIFEEMAEELWKEVTAL